MTSCPHGYPDPCDDCDIDFLRRYLAQVEDLSLAIKRLISTLAQRRSIEEIPVIGRVEPSGNVIYWHGLGEK